MKHILAFLLLLACTALRAYEPPQGIPDPAIYFGWEIDRATPSWPASWLAGTPSATPGFYYVDKTAPGNTNSGNTYGHPGLPRSTPPYMGALAAGSFVYVHAGTYTHTDFGGPFALGGAGTSENPIWFTGNPSSRPVIQQTCQVGNSTNASFCVIENFVFSYGGVVSGSKRYAAIDIRGTQQNIRSDHIIVRGCDLSGEVDLNSQGGIGAGGVTVKTTTVSAVADAGSGKVTLTVVASGLFRVGEDCTLAAMTDSGYNGTWLIDAVPDATHLTIVKPYEGDATGDAYCDFPTEFVVAYNNTCHDHGRPPQENSEHYYFYQSQRSRYMWVLDSTAWAIGADPVAGGHNANDTNAKAHHLYIGRNSFADPTPDTIAISAAADAGGGKTTFTVATTTGIPGGDRATATANISGGAITSISVTEGGENYWHCGVVISGDGSGAWALGQTNTAGEVSGVLLGSGGTGYSTATVLLLGRAVFVSEPAEYRGMWEVEEVVDATHVTLRVPYAGDLAGTIDISGHSGENAIDLKCIRYVVISDNYMQGPYMREQGWACVHHSGSAPVPVRDCWNIFNRVERCTTAFMVTSTNGGYSVNFIGNDIRDCYDKYSVPDFQGDGWNGAAIRHMVCEGDNYIVDNTLTDYEEGIIVSYVPSGSTATVHGNIMHSRNRALGYDLLAENESDLARVDADYNFYPASPRIWWGNTPGIVTSLAAFQAGTDEEDHGQSGDPLFTNYAAGNVTLQSGSPAKDASVKLTAAYAAFEAMFGVNIEKDIAEVARPQNTTWDIGAYEYTSGGGGGGGGLNATTLNITNLIIE